jgi:hypothetical protein
MIDWHFTLKATEPDLLFHRGTMTVAVSNPGSISLMKVTSASFDTDSKDNLPWRSAMLLSKTRATAMLFSRKIAPTPTRPKTLEVQYDSRFLSCSFLTFLSFPLFSLILTALYYFVLNGNGSTVKYRCVKM